MDTLSESEAFVALLIQYFAETDLIDWAQTYAQAHPELNSDSSLFALARLNRNRKDQLSQTRSLMEYFVAEVEPTFDAGAEGSQAIAKNLFVRRLQDYLNEECTPWEVCRMVQPIEQIYDFPIWLGDMFNACDWIEPDLKPVDCRHLEQVIRAHLKDLGSGNL